MVLLPQSEVNNRMLRGMSKFIETHCVPLSLYYNDRPGSKTLLQILELYPPSGVIGNLADPAIRNAVVDRGIPSVNISGLREEVVKQLPTVTMDNQEIGFMAANYLIDRGYDHLISLSIPTFFSAERERGFILRAHARGRQVSALTCESLAIRTQKIEDWRYTYFDEAKVRNYLGPLKGKSAIFCHDDLKAQHLGRVLEEMGYRIPYDFALLGCDNEERFCHLGTTPRSSVNVNSDLIGYEATALLWQILNGYDPGQSVRLIPPKGIVERASSDWVKIEDEAIRRAVDYMHQNLHRKISVPQIAKAAGVSRRILEMRFKRDLEDSVGRKLNEFRMEKVSRLLRETKIPIGHISKLTGFSSSQRLATVFRKETGLTLSDYRKRYSRNRRAADPEFG
ncbi:MAG: substrate-binding domain-containing protein [Opitutales bacterium]|nr:substrate-binding domain-containing protein [Opitutales bacterium]